jgi:amino acid adenylation domain-containing protein
MEEESLTARLRRHADRDPDRPALTFVPLDPAASRTTLSYGQVVQRSAALAAALARRLRPGERAVLLLPTVPEFAVAFLGCLAVGVIAVPLPLPADEASRRRVVGVLRDCAPSLIVSTSFVYRFAAAAPEELRWLRGADQWLLVDEQPDATGAIDPGGGMADPGGSMADPVTVRAADIAFLQYTSGSTSTPRGVLVSHGALLHNEAAIGAAFGVRPDSTVVSWLPLHHDMGLIGGLLQPLYAGARGIVLDPLSFLRRPASWLETIARERADISGGPNFAYEMCTRKVTDAELAELDLSSWRVAFNGAGQVHPRTLRAFSERFAPAGFAPAAHTPCYGLAEATLLVASTEPGTGGRSTAFTRTSLEAGRPEPAETAGSAALELIGYPLPPHACVTVIDPDTAAPLPDGHTGEIVVAGRSNGSGYWGDAKGSAVAFGLRLPGQPAPAVRTGDLGFIHGGELFLQGRCKDLIVHRGRNLYPEDLEADVSACHPDVRPGCGAVFAVDQDGDEAVVVCQEIRADTPAPRWPEIAGRIRETVALVHGVTARTVALVPPKTITKTSSGKIQRQAARQRYLAGELPVLMDSTTGVAEGAGGPSLASRLGAFQAAAEPAARADLLTRALCEYLRDLLGLADRPAPTESLAGLGVDSLAATQVQYALESALRVALPPSVALRAASITELAAVALAAAPALAELTIAPAPAELGAAPALPAAVSGEVALDRAADAEYELTQAQRALWFLHRVAPDSPAYNVTRAFRVVGELSGEALDGALTRLVQRHPSLRLSVRSVAGEPQAVLRPRTVRADRVDGRAWSGQQLTRWYRELATTPFDLARDPLLRAAVLRRAGDWLVVLSLHHIVCDIASLTVLIAELAHDYAVLTGAPPAEDPPAEAGPAAAGRSGTPGQPSVTPAQRERVVLADRGAELAAYWQRELAGELPVLALPRPGSAGSNRPEPGQGESGCGEPGQGESGCGEPGQGESGCGEPAAGAVQFEAPPGLTAALTGFARRSGLTLHNVLLAAYQILLHRLSGQSDLLVGIPTAGRTDPRLAAYVGYLVNVVPVRSRGPGILPFAEYARRTQERVLDALDHQDLPLAQITRLVNPDRDAAGSAIFQAMFTFYGSALPGGAAAAGVVAGDPAATVPLGRTATLHGFPVPDYTSQSDIGLNAVVRAGVLGFELQYDRQRVSHRQAEQLATALGNLLAAIGDDPQALAARLPLLSAAEAEAAVAAGIGPAIARPGHYLDALEQVSDRHPEAVAADDGVTTLTYAELDQRANHVAARLRALGVGMDRNVVVCAQRSTDYLVALLGIHKADGCYVPISPIEAPRRAAAMLAATAPAAVIADATGQWLLEGPQADPVPPDPVPLDLAELVAGRSPRRVPRTSHDHAACTIIHTSGSTGLPKAAVSTNYGVTNHMWQMVEHFGLGPQDCVAQTGPVSFDISVWQFLTPLIVGGRVRIVPEPASQSPAKLLAVVAEGVVTMLELVPSAIVALLDAGLAASPGRLRVMLSTGESLTPEVLRRWVGEMPGIPVHNTYGPAECTDDVTGGLCAHGPGERFTTSIGRPLANTTVHVLDEELAPVPAGVTSMLYVGWGAVGRGYRGDPRRTAERFVPDPWSPVPGGRLYRTGDLGRRADSGELDFLGRADSQTKVRGLRIEAGEVEGALRQCPGVTAAALRIHQGSNGSVLVGYVVLDEPDRPAGDPDSTAGAEGRLLGPAEDERLRTALAQHLPRYMIPTLLVALPRLPRSKNGKVDYQALRYAGPARADAEDPGLAEDPLAAAVRGIWAALLAREVGWQDSFFELGGHSLLALAMVDRVGELLDVEVPVDAVFGGPRLDQFVGWVRRAGQHPGGGDRVRRTAAGSGYPAPASAAQERFWYLRERDPDQPTYNMPGVLSLHGELDEDALEAALREVLGRHPVLLARFTERRDGLYWSPGSLADFELPRLDLRGAVAEFGTEAFTSLAEAEAGVVADLRRELPFRAMLARLGAADWSLFVVVDHIVCDGWSLSVFLADLAEAYNGRRRSPATANGRSPTEPDQPRVDGDQPRPNVERPRAGVDRPPARPGYSFADYCHEERARRLRLDRAEVLAEWRGLAGGPLALSPLPPSPLADQARPQPATGTGQVVLWIETDLAAAIRTLAARTGTTPYMVFATALAALTHSGADRRETVLLGTLIAQRDRPEWRGIVGPLLSVGVLAVDLAPTDPVAAALHRTRDGALRAYRASHLPFQELAPLFPAAPGGDGSPFEVLLVLQPADTPAVFDGLVTELEDLVPAAAAYPLIVDIEQRGERYRVSCRYAAQRYDHAGVADLASRLDAAVRATVADPDRPLGRLCRPEPQPLGTQPPGTQPLGTQPPGTQPPGTQPPGTQPLGTPPAGAAIPGAPRPDTPHPDTPQPETPLMGALHAERN